ncbi:MAG: hypothetical protein KKH94_13190 [Candidatus Omnitrophica bacterium]|nr:hypothetical protein [Candidatus Omnitrophota bacterium]
METEGAKKIERRRGPDFWVRSLSWFSGISWVLLLTSFVILDKARPRTQTFYQKFYNAKGNFSDVWDATLLQYLFCIMAVGLCASIVGVIINCRRHRRDGDKYHIPVIIVGILSVIGIFVYLFFGGGVGKIPFLGA